MGTSEAASNAEICHHFYLQYVVLIMQSVSEIPGNQSLAKFADLSVHLLVDRHPS
ncbi:hypothetical protein KIN20_021232 [Parelaphostrongylus tenuis]|uniref:Uncharacterized protein n=1 Tax=Parelaphostrongylus tenuis TaxID=148309 RepID=A0AAD5MNM4_PARTN|nr:hypothetical protein KIN20_021232 [Parelaphostrongylus tenuis]